MSMPLTGVRQLQQEQAARPQEARNAAKAGDRPVIGQHVRERAQQAHSRIQPALHALRASCGTGRV
jgi:hypothetical protein